MKKILLAFLTLSVIVLAGNFVEGIRAYMRGDYKKAAEYFKKAADEGEVEAQVQMGHMYEYGYGVKQDDVKAFSYYKIAAEHNSSNANYMLGAMYEDGRGTKQSFDEATQAYKRACDLEDDYGCKAYTRLNTQ